MKRSIVIFSGAILCTALLVSGCRASDQSSTGGASNVVVPDVTINQPAEAEKKTITVSGSGKVNLTPDMASITMEVSTTAATAEDAQQQNSEIMNTVMESLKNDGIDEKDIATSDIYINEKYDYDQEPPVAVGYEMCNRITVTMYDVDKVGAIIANAIAAGVTDTYGLNFSISNDGTGYADALKAAITDASEKAAAMAEALGVEIETIPTSISESSTSYAPVLYEEAVTADAVSMSSGSNDVSISTGELTVTAEVSAVYVIVEAK